MKTTAFELALNRRPYGLELQPTRNGLVLRPRRKARANWSKAFRLPLRCPDELGAIRGLTNEFDRNEWER